MRRFNWLMVSFCCLLALSCSGGIGKDKGPMTIDQVKPLLMRVSAAMRDRDRTALEETFAPDAEVIVLRDGINLTFSPDAFVREITMPWDKAEEYTFFAGEPDFTYLDPVITADQHYDMVSVFMQYRTTASFQNTFTISRVGGEPKIIMLQTKIDTKVQRR